MGGVGVRMRLLLAGLVAAIAAVAVTPVAQAGRPSFAGDLLAMHNAERAATGAPPLVWDEELAEEAAGYAGRLARRDSPLVHSSPDERDGQGENLWRGTAGFFRLPEMFGMWADERRYFRPGVFPKISRGVPWHVVGHYTQIIWRDTERVGCAVREGEANDYLVCRYWPAGNVYGRYVS